MEDNKMKKLFLIFSFFLLSTPLFSQNIRIFGTGTYDNNSTKIKYDIEGNPVIVVIGDDKRFYSLKSLNGNFETPKPIFYYPSSIAQWDFDIDAYGNLHIGFITREEGNLKFYYFNTFNQSASLIFDTLISNPNLWDYSVNVLRTLDNQLIVNFVFVPYYGYWYQNDYYYSVKYVWYQLVNSSGNNLNLNSHYISINPYLKPVNPYDALYLRHQTNKNLFIQIYHADWVVSNSSINGTYDSLVQSYTLLSVNQTGNVINLNASSHIQVIHIQNNPPINRQDPPFRNVPVLIADKNNSYYTWIHGVINLNIFTPYPIPSNHSFRNVILDNANNLHIIKKENNKLFYEIYTSQNFPINSANSVYLRRIEITPQNVTYRANYSINIAEEIFAFDAFNPDKSIIMFPSVHLPLSNILYNVGSALIYNENGNLRTEYLLTVGSDRNKLIYNVNYLKRNNYLWISNNLYDSLNQNTGRIYFYKLKSLNDDFISNLRDNEILNIDFPQFTPALPPKKIAVSKDNLIYIVSIIRDTSYYIAGTEYRGRPYLVREISPFNWETQIITSDSFYYNYTNFDFYIDDNGKVHFVYSFNRKIYYTNNVNGNFLPPLRIDSVYISGNYGPLETFPVGIKVSANGKVYVISKTQNGFTYYYGNYSTGFTKSTRTIFGSEFPTFEVDSNGNLFVFENTYISFGSSMEYYLMKFRDNNQIYRKKYLTLPYTSHNFYKVLSWRDSNEKVHFLSSLSGYPKIYYGNSSDEFSTINEIDISQFNFLYQFGLDGFVNLIEIFHHVEENKVYFTFVLSGRNAELYPTGLGTYQFGQTSVKNDQLQLPTSFKLHQNFPNPFNPSTKIKYELPEKTQVNISVYDILGQKVKELKNEIHEPGFYEIEFNASNLSSGVYFYLIEAGKFKEARKMLLIK